MTNYFISFVKHAAYYTTLHTLWKIFISIYNLPPKDKTQVLNNTLII